MRPALQETRVTAGTQGLAPWAETEDGAQSGHPPRVEGPGRVCAQRALGAETWCVTGGFLTVGHAGAPAWGSMQEIRPRAGPAAGVCPQRCPGDRIGTGELQGHPVPPSASVSDMQGDKAGCRRCQNRLWKPRDPCREGSSWCNLGTRAGTVSL